MTDRELMQQALEALEAYRPVIVKRYGLTYSVGDKAITVLRERLAQPDPVPYWHSEFLKHNTTSGQPAQQQEPVAQEWRYYFSHSGATGKPDEVVGPCFTDKKEVAFGVGCFDQTALCPPASKTEQQEPVAYSYTSRITGAQGFSHHPMPRFIDSESWDIKPLYTSPPAQRKPLTDEEIVKITSDPCLYIRGGDYRIDIARAIEAAHGIKGEA